ncbi:hypothetical protein C5C67_00365 [Rathayibacter sp. AY1E1]|nr:hypothetical protein C5C67_00365 [Rathayibacter sp. AY1E1]
MLDRLAEPGREGRALAAVGRGADEAERDAAGHRIDVLADEVRIGRDRHEQQGGSGVGGDAGGGAQDLGSLAVDDADEDGPGGGGCGHEELLPGCAPSWHRAGASGRSIRAGSVVIVPSCAGLGLEWLVAGSPPAPDPPSPPSSEENARVSKPGIPTPEESAGTPTTAPLTRREAREAERRAARAETETGAATAGTAVEGSGSDDSAASAGAGDSAPTAVDAATAAATAPTVSVEVPAVASPASRSIPASPRRASASRPVAPRAAEPARARGLSRRALAFGTFSVVGGLFATAAIPAYGARSSSATATGRAAANRVGLQNLTVSSDAAGQTAVRDAFAAPTQAQLDEASRQAAVLSGSNGGEFSTVQTRAVGDDYPWPYETIDDDGGGLSPLGYYYRECVDFVAWRLNRDAGRTSAPWKYTWGNITPLGGSAYEWPDNWAAKGWATSSVPIVGCVAWWTYNHVSYVQKVNDDGTVLLEEYNYGGKHSYVTRTFPTAQVPLFLYPPVL